MKIQSRILTLAFLARVMVFIVASRGFFLIGEGRVEADLACNLLEGNGFMLSGEMLHPPEEVEGNEQFRETMTFYRSVDGYYGVLRPDRPTLFLVPGYAFFMAGIFALFGLKNYLAVRGIQLLLGLLTVWIGFRIARKFLSGRYLTLAGIFMALDPFELYYEAIPATQALFSLLFLCGILISIKLITTQGNMKSRILLSVSAGMVWGIAFLVRPAALPFIVWLAVRLPFIPFIRRFTLVGKASAKGKAVSFRWLVPSAVL
ncbi:MAG: glycosyltransferase family 39 protein, partial [FCB group bacterium]|nr:glycosyltransferase family 39 protein [FCB group bacterium]